MSGMNGRTGWVVPCLTLIVLGTIATCLPAPAEAGPTTHPVYDDGDTLRWYASLSEAQRVARREGIFLLVEVSPARSKPCANVIALIGDKQVRPRIRTMAVGHHIDPKTRSPLIPVFRRNLPAGSHLPWVGLFTHDGKWISGFAPSRRTSVAELRRRFLTALDAGEKLQRRAAGNQVPDHKPRSSSTRESAPAPKPQPTKPRTSSTRTQPKTQPKPSTSGGSSQLVWYESFDEAQAAAQAGNKIILVTSTKPNCSLCVKLRNKIVPQVWGQMRNGCVCYVYNILSPEDRSIDRMVRRGNPNGRLMPISGFMTADRRWLHGFYGSTDAQQLMRDYRSARAKR